MNETPKIQLIFSIKSIKLHGVHVFKQKISRYIDPNRNGVIILKANSMRTVPSIWYFMSDKPGTTIFPYIYIAIILYKSRLSLIFFRTQRKFHKLIKHIKTNNKILQQNVNKQISCVLLLMQLIPDLFDKDLLK